MSRTAREVIAELKELLAKATPAPWVTHKLPYDGFDDPIITGGEGVYIAQTVYDMQSYTQKHNVDADTKLIAALRNSVELLIELAEQTLASQEPKP